MTTKHKTRNGLITGLVLYYLIIYTNMKAHNESSVKSVGIKL